MFNEKLVDFIRLIVQYPMGCIIEGYQAAVDAQVCAELRHFVADMRVLFTPDD